MTAGLPRVAVVYNAPVLPPDHADAASEGDVVKVARAVLMALERDSFAPTLVPASPPLGEFLDALIALKPDVVFNLIEGFNGLSAGATHLTSVFELTGLPYTGSSVECLAACVSKSRAKALLRGFGLPTTDSLLIEPHEAIPSVEFVGPMLVKPDAEDGSLGIDQGSVVSNRTELSARVEFLRTTHPGAVIVEPYLPGPEFNLGMIAVPELRTLAVSEIRFRPTIGRWPILTYEAKWQEGSEADFASLPVCPAAIAPELAARLSKISIAAFRVTNCRDYARVDIRLDGDGEPMILEVNPNPDISPSAGWARAAGVSGFAYEKAIGLIARQALERCRRREKTE